VTVIGGLTINTASLSPPSNLQATAVTTTRIDLSWTDNATAESGFRIQRKTGAGSFSQIAQVGANVTTFINQTGLAPATQYTYRVRAFNGSGNSAFSNEETETTPSLPAAPSDVQGTLVPGPRIDLTWTDNTINANVTSFSDTPIQAGKTYTYFLRAVSPAGTSVNSNQTVVVVPSLPTSPNNLTAQALTGPRRVVLNWNDRSGNEDRFFIYRRIGAGAYVFKGSVLANITTFTDTTVSSGVTYTYAVKAGNAAGYSGLTFPAATVSVP
jgi:fibronectin type 3 domain-containing protein